MTHAMPDVDDLDELVYDASYAGPLRVRYWRDDGLRIATSDGQLLHIREQCICRVVDPDDEFYWREWRVETVELASIDKQGYGCLRCRCMRRSRPWSMKVW